MFNNHTCITKKKEEIVITLKGQVIYTLPGYVSYQSSIMYIKKYKLTNLSSWTRWAVILDPEAPKGWPIAIAPPLTLSFSISSFNSFWQARVWAPNASLILKIFNHIKFMFLRLKH